MMAVTLPSFSARMLFSIFIDSSVSSTSPFLTSAPTATATFTTDPGSGDTTLYPPAGAAGFGAAGAGAAGCGCGAGCGLGAGAAGCAAAATANSISLSSCITFWPGVTSIDFTTPSASAEMLFSIFIDSMVSSTSPFFTLCPASTSTRTMEPGSGDAMNLTLPVAGAAAGALVAAAGLATGRVVTFSSFSISTVNGVPFTSSSATLFSISFTDTSYLCPSMTNLNFFIGLFD